MSECIHCGKNVGEVCRGCHANREAVFTAGPRVDHTAVFERLRKCDGRDFDCAVVVWEDCQILVAGWDQVRDDLAKAKDVIRQLADRVAAQSEALSRRAEKAPVRAGRWGALPQEPCRFCRQVGGVHFLIDDGPEGRSGLSPVRCDRCKRDWIAGEVNA